MWNTGFMEHTLGNIILERNLFIISQLPSYLQVTDMCLDWKIQKQTHQPGRSQFVWKLELRIRPGECGIWLHPIEQHMSWFHLFILFCCFTSDKGAPSCMWTIYILMLNKEWSIFSIHFNCILLWKCICWNPNPNVMVYRSGIFEKWLLVRMESSWVGLIVHTREAPERSFSPPAMWSYR